MSNYPGYKLDRYQVVAMDADGFDLGFRRDFTSKKDAKAFAKELAAEPRAYWVQEAESESFPDEIEAIALYDQETLIDEFKPKFKDA